jgi:hypothetical protein
LNKRLTKSDYIFSLVFLFMLICVLGAFFFGVQYGTGKSEARFNKQMNAKTEEAKGLPAYHQSYLVSFYHTIYLPYRDFETVWFKNINQIDLGGGSVDPASLMKEISKLADEKYQASQSQTMPDTSPVLQEAHNNYLKSLKLFSQAADQFRSKANSLKGAQLIAEIEKDPTFAEAKSFALQAQKGYYDAIVKWNEATSPNLAGKDLLGGKSLALADWNSFNLNLKNDYTASLLLKNRSFNAYTPQDMVYKIDEMIKSGQAPKLKLTTIEQVAETLASTNAVRPGDFLQGKSRWYAGEPLPQLPFFFSSN